MLRFGLTMAVAGLLLVGCPSQEIEPVQSTWTDIPDTDDKILMTASSGTTQEAVVDVLWDDAKRAQLLADGFSRGGEAANTRAVYRFDCKALTIQTRSYSVLTQQGETLLSQIDTTQAIVVAPGTTSSRYLVAACHNRLKPGQIKNLLAQ